MLPFGELSAQFRRIPDNFIRTIHEHTVLMWEFKPNSLNDQKLYHILAFDIAAVNSKNFKNLHLRAELTVLLSFFAPLIGYEHIKEDSHLQSVIFEHPLCIRYLLPTIIEAYGDVEKTGH